MNSQFLVDNLCTAILYISLALEDLFTEHVGFLMLHLHCGYLHLSELHKDISCRFNMQLSLYLVLLR